MKYLFFLSAFFIAFQGFAQKGQNVYLLKNNGKEVKIRDSADYIRIIREPDSGKVYYELVEYYKNGDIKRTGYTSSSTSVKLEGEVISYYQNGNKKSVLNYQKNKRFGESLDYYENGNLKEHRLYLNTVSGEADFGSSPSYKLIQLADSTGNPFLDDQGNGKISLKTSSSLEEGEYKNGFKHGLWKDDDRKQKLSHEEIYEDGKFISGVYKTDDGETGTYTIKQKLPQFRGGNKSFGEYLSRNIVYPKDARAAKQQGRVLLTFVVEKDGSLSDIKVLRSVTPSMDAEAVRVLKKSPKWTPGIQNGRPVKVSYSLPIVFSLGKG